MSRFTPLLLACGVLFVTKNTMSEFHLLRMPSAHRRMAFGMLSYCRGINDELMAETTDCEAHVRRLTQSSRCRSLNVHLEMAETRLHRLEEFMLLRQLESLQIYLTGCQQNALGEVQRLEAERLDLQQTVAEVAQSIEDQEVRERAVILETDALREEEKSLDCEFNRLETERRMLEKHLQLQATALKILSGQKQVKNDLTEAIEAAAAEQERAAEICRQQTLQHQRGLASCQEQVSLEEAQLGAMQEPAPEIEVQLEEDLVACRKEAASCANTTDGCAAELKAVSMELTFREMAVLVERGRSQGCQRELIATTGRFARCRSSGRHLFTHIQSLQVEARGSENSASRLDHCYKDSSSCGSQSATCTQELSDLHENENACKKETSVSRDRWQRCNDSIAGLERDTLAPLQVTANELEVVVNETVALGRECEEEGLHVRADRGFAEEDLMRGQAVLKTAKEQLAECQLGCWPAPEGAHHGEITGGDHHDGDTYDMSDW